MSLNYKDNGSYAPRVVYFSNNDSWSSYCGYQHSYEDFRGNELHLKTKNFEEEVMLRDYSFSSCSKKIKISNDRYPQCREVNIVYFEI